MQSNDIRRHERARERIRKLARSGKTFRFGPCKRDGCNHSPDDHILDESINTDPFSFVAMYPCAVDGCGCVDCIQNIILDRRKEVKQ